MRIRYFDTLPSTNRYCKLLSQNETEEFDVIVAREQTNGIGQRGNHWESDGGCNLTFSIILKPVFLAMSDQYMMTKAVALGVHDWVSSILHDEARSVKIKWPNDIYVGDKKICGILIENDIQNQHLMRSIVGIGININQTQFSTAAGRATSLKLESGHDVDLESALTTVVTTIEGRYRQLASGATDKIDSDYLLHLYQRGESASYCYQGAVLTAVIEGVNRYGHLILHSANGRKITCQLKEIQFLSEPR